MNTNKSEYLPDWNLISTNELLSSEKLIMFVIKYHIGKNEYSTVSQTRISSETRLSRTTVIKLLRSIERKGWITITNRDYTTCEYRLVKSKFLHRNYNYCTPPVTTADTTLCVEFTGGCKTNLHKDNKTKKLETKKEKKEKKAFAVDTAEAPHFFNTKETVGNNEHIEECGDSKDIHYKNHNSPLANVATLEKVWKTVLPQKYPDKSYIAPLTSKERGMLKCFISRLDSDYDPANVFKKVLIDWDDFVMFFWNLDRNTATPAKPSIPFILKHAEDTVNFLCYMEKEKAKLIELEENNKKDRILALKSRIKELQYFEARKHFLTIKNEVYQHIENEYKSTGRYNEIMDMDIELVVIIREQCDYYIEELATKCCIKLPFSGKVLTIKNYDTTNT